MIPVTPELRAEAERLLQLNDHGIQVERLAMALGIGAQSEKAQEELRRLDMEFLNGFIDQPARIGTQPGESNGGGIGPGEIPAP